MIGRRLLVGAGISALVAPALGLAQPAIRPRQVVVIAPSREQLSKFDYFETAMKDRAAAAGFAINLVSRFAATHPDGSQGVVAEVLAMQPDVIVAANTPIIQAVLATGARIPVVMAVVGDREGAGVISRSPDQNVTGVTTLVGAMAAKRLALLKEAVPGIVKVMALYHPDDPIVLPQQRDIAAAAPALGLTLRAWPVREPGELDAIFSEATGWGAQALFRLAGQSARTLQRTIELTRVLKLPAMHVLQEDVRQGGLLAYYASFDEHWERVAALVERILRGTPARELPIEQPTRFELVLNLATARAIGLSIPLGLVAQASEVIE